MAFKSGLTCVRLTVGGQMTASEVLCSAHKALALKGLGIISAVTSQTSIGIMINSRDRLRVLDVLEGAMIMAMDRVRSEDNLAIIGLVGERLEGEPEIVARCILDLAGAGIRMHMSGSGGSPLAYYLIVREEDVREAVRVLHGTCSGSRLNLTGPGSVPVSD